LMLIIATIFLLFMVGQIVEFCTIFAL